MEKLKLVSEAKAFAQAELEKAEAGGDLGHKARWLETLGDLKAAAAAWLAADRKDKAAWVFEQLGDLAQAAQLLEAAGQLDKAQALFQKQGDTANAERVKALPRPEPRPRATESAPAVADAMPPPAEASADAVEARP
jgi:tetratricopeptide (TPR) repeat protein